APIQADSLPTSTDHCPIGVVLPGAIELDSRVLPRLLGLARSQQRRDWHFVLKRAHDRTRGACRGAPTAQSPAGASNVRALPARTTSLPAPGYNETFSCGDPAAVSHAMFSVRIRPL